MFRILPLWAITAFGAAMAALGNYEAILSKVTPLVERIPLPPQRLIDAIGGGDGIGVGRLNMRYLLENNMTEASAVLEPGCGFGRNARWLAPFLSAAVGGRYEGFDILPELTEWGTEHITSRYDHVRFRTVNVVNEHYLHWQNVDHENFRSADEFKFPYESSSFDIVFAPSVFTHLLQPAVETYLRESFRVLRPGGRAMMWFFVLDEAAKTALRESPDKFVEGIRMVPHSPVSWALKSAPEAAIAFEESYLESIAHKLGFEFGSVIRGHWRIPAGGLKGNSQDFQDIVFFHKPTAEEVPGILKPIGTVPATSTRAPGTPTQADTPSIASQETGYLSYNPQGDTPYVMYIVYTAICVFVAGFGSGYYKYCIRRNRGRKHRRVRRCAEQCAVG